MTDFFTSHFNVGATKSKAIDVYAKNIAIAGSNIALPSDMTGESGATLDIARWLPACSEALNISADIRDYVLIPVPIIWSMVPNTNGDCFTRHELLKWQNDYGCQTYMTFKGKPAFVEHNNTNHERASGVIFDVYARKMPNVSGDRIIVVLLMGYDRNRDPKSANAIRDNKCRTFSMGSRYAGYTCSMTGKSYRPGEGSSPFTKPGVPLYMENGRLVYRMLFDLCFFETSLVELPAFPLAVGGELLEVAAA